MEGVTTAEYNADVNTLEPPYEYEKSAFAWFIMILVCITATVSFTGNLLVILALFFDKKLLKVNFNIFILNLAITDLNASCVGMVFFALELYFGRWVFDKVTCAIWILSDWAMTSTSVFFLVAISIDRCWAACRPKSYRSLNVNKKKSIISVGIVWVALLTVYIPPFIVDRLRGNEPGVCTFNLDTSRGFAVFVSLVGYHLPSLVIVVCYYKIFMVMRRSGAAFTKTKVTPVAVQTGTVTSVGEASGPSTATDLKQQEEKKHKVQNAKDKKIFVSLSYIVFSYLLTWLPWHFTFDVLLIAPEKVGFNLYIFTNWTAYFNSLLNPLMYAASSRDFRIAMKNVILLKCIRGQN